MYERHKEPLAPRAAFVRRLARHAAIAVGVVTGSLALGVLGYHGLEGLPWIDALLNAAMILAGMGPVSDLHTAGGKLFASFYALYSGLVFLVVAGLLFVPIFHRFAHHFHLELEDDAGQAEPEHKAGPQGQPPPKRRSRRLAHHR
jgi:hypothetical protein